jgi:hypothetical protein
MKYAGVGSRSTPLPIIREMENVAMRLAIAGWQLRTGAGKRPLNPKPDTDSADLAFERACKLVGGQCVVRVPTLWEPAVEHAAKFHPNWDACNEFAQGAHARNSMIVLGDGRAFDDPVDAVVCWTAGGVVKGGTGQALRIAAAWSIPVFNLAIDGALEAFWCFVGDRS